MPTGAASRLHYLRAPIAGIRALAFNSRYRSDWRAYSRLPGAPRLRLKDGYPCLADAGPATDFDPHYLYQAAWALDVLAREQPQHHVDIGSDLRFVASVAALLSITFVDIRPPHLDLPRLDVIPGDVTKLPWDERALASVSCLHVAEHVGLGRYGDNLDADGTVKACAELERVLAPEGTLLFSVPVGRPRVCFNAHRIHAPRQILGYFPSLTLLEFSAVRDDGSLVRNADLDELALASYGCGLFSFTRR